jgi:hypothetical protein
MQRGMHAWYAGVLAAAAVLAVGTVGAACGGGGTSSGTSASSTPAPVASPSPSSSALSGQAAQIAANWEAFFAGTTPADRKIGLLQNGQQFANVINAQADSPISQSTTAKVSAVTLDSDTAATVTYSILLGGQVALADQTGQAVLEGGVWKVGAQSFQALLALQGASGVPSPSTSP